MQAFSFLLFAVGCVTGILFSGLDLTPIIGESTALVVRFNGRIDQNERGAKHGFFAICDKSGVILESSQDVDAFRESLALSTEQHTPQPPLNSVAFSYTPVAAQMLLIMERALLGTLFSDQVGRCGGGKGGCALGSVLPFDASLRLGGQDWPPVGHTMVGGQRLQNAREALEMAVQLGVPGDFAELGVWRGGVCIYAKAILDLLCESGEGRREVLVFDAFQDLPGYDWGGYTQYLSVSESLVRGAFDAYGVNTSGVKFIKGLFKDTLPSFRKARLAAGSKPISVLRIDGNFYDSHQDALYYLYDFVPVGGVIIFDDFTHLTAERAWHDFQADQDFSETATKLPDPDKNGAWFVKTVAVKVDMSKMRPAEDCNKQ